MKRIWGILVAVLALLGGGLLLAPAAQASGYGCSGNLIDNYPVTYSGSTFGNVYLYYDSSTGKNCAVTVSNSSHGYGSSKWMVVELEKCTQTVDTGTCSSYSPAQEVKDQGNYLYQAGPVSISAAGHCILIYGRIDWAGNTGGAFDIGHCG